MLLILPPYPFKRIAAVDRLRGRYAHAIQRRKIRDRRNDQPPGILEADEATIKQVVDTGCEQQAVLAVEPLVIGVAIAPGLSVACSKVLWVVHAGDSALTLDDHHPLVEQALSALAAFRR